MRLTHSIVVGAAASVIMSAAPALAWGAAGHEIVATIAQIHLDPRVAGQVREILPPWASGRLASVAAWADTIRGRMRETGPMHYINPLGDHPADHCTYGETGWTNDDVNVVTAIINQTTQLLNRTGSDRDIPLRFLTHFIGDMHQPLHLTGRDRGGNDAAVLFEGRRSRLHSVWDGQLLNKMIREQGNYTRPTGDRRIESALHGAVYDPLIRFIVTEGIRGWWADEWQAWSVCPEEGDPFPHTPATRLQRVVGSAAAFLGSRLPEGVQSTLGIDRLAALASAPAQAITTSAPFLPVCPYTWSKPLHTLNCAYVWPRGLETNHWPLTELDTPDYYGRLRDDKVVHKLLAMAGIRLAAVLNSVLLGKVGQQVAEGPVVAW